MSNVIDLKSDEGQAMLRDVINNGWPFQPTMMEIFSKQTDSAGCGIQTCALLLSAAAIAKEPAGSWVKGLKIPMTEEDMFLHPATIKVKSKAEIGKDGHGVSLTEVCQILNNHGCKAVHKHSASDSSPDVFRALAKQALRCSCSESCVMVNYHMDVLGQKNNVTGGGLPFGHHSPLCAYHETVDRFLILDTWRESEVCWAKTGALYNAMNTIDSDSGETRGFCILEF